MHKNFLKCLLRFRCLDPVLLLWNDCSQRPYFIKMGFHLRAYIPWFLQHVLQRHYRDTPLQPIPPLQPANQPTKTPKQPKKPNVSKSSDSLGMGSEYLYFYIFKFSWLCWRISALIVTTLFCLLFPEQVAHFDVSEPWCCSLAWIFILEAHLKGGLLY